MNNFWDERFDTDELIYGSNPNNFLKLYIDNNTPGSILLPGEGEGRNAIYAASKSWNVTAHDGSQIAKTKALKLASSMELNFEYIVCDILELNLSQQFDAIGLIYLHLPPAVRRLAHRNLIKHLKPNASLFLEMFSKKQIQRNTGGPKNIDMLYNLDDLKEDFNTLDIVSVKEETIILDEGTHHAGEADVIRAIFTKQF